MYRGMGRRLREVLAVAGVVADGHQQDVRARESLQVLGVPCCAPHVPGQGARHVGDEGSERGGGEVVRCGKNFSPGKSENNLRGQMPKGNGTAVFQGFSSPQLMWLEKLRLVFED